MREDVLAVLRQYKNEIVEYNQEVDINDWWHYLDDVAINAHDYEETGNITVNGYPYDEEGWTIVSHVLFTYTFTLEEFADL
jgi:hypothetical protein